MSRTIDLRRHTDDDGDALSAEGVAAAIAMGEQLVGDLTFAVSTGAQRATQTIACALGATSLTVVCGVIVETGLRSQVEDRWKQAVKAAGDPRLSSIRSVDAELVEGQAELLGAALRAVVDRVADGHRALVVGHSPTNEAAVLGLTGQEVEPMAKGAGVRITEAGGAWQLEPLAAASFELRGH